MEAKPLLLNPLRLNFCFWALHNNLTKLIGLSYWNFRVTQFFNWLMLAVSTMSVIRHVNSIFLGQHETKREVWLLRTWFSIGPVNKLDSLTWLLWRLEVFGYLHYITLQVTTRVLFVLLQSSSSSKLSIAYLVSRQVVAKAHGEMLSGLAETRKS